MGTVRFVPLVGEAGWEPSGDTAPTEAPPAPPEPETVPEHIAFNAESFGDLSTADLDALLRRIGDARVACIGETTHGTSEFYRMRARIQARLPDQFDEYIWFDETEAVTPLKKGVAEGMPETFPFGV